MPDSWSVLIADDEPAARRGVRQLLKPFPEFTVVGECRNGYEVLAAFELNVPDLIFLDIQMPGMDGFEVIRRRTPERMPIVIFLTAYSQFALPAFEAQVLDYLVKPVNQARFAAAMKRATKQLRTQAGDAREDTIAVPTAHGAVLLRAQEIDWIQAEGNYARLWVGRSSYLVREPLRVLERRLLGSGFIRAHRRALVRLGSIREVNWANADTPAAVLQFGVCIPVSRRRRAGFVAAVRRLGAQQDAP
jgi:two-component system LytT family response regulator